MESDRRLAAAATRREIVNPGSGMPPPAFAERHVAGRIPVRPMPISDHIRNKLSQVPHRPGVYLHKDRFGTVIYVGKARDLRKRVSQYFHPSRRMGWDLKFNALVDAIHDFDWHVVRNEPESLLLESKLVKDFQPRFNIDLKDDKRFLLLKVNLRTRTRAST
jgi:excinuclease UvrABC nuclease subunit